MPQAVVVDAVRTPIARAHPEKGFFRDTRSDDLSADLLCALLQRTGIQAGEIDDIYWGCVKQYGEQGYNVGRMAALIAGIPVEVPAVSVNRNCGAGLEAVNQAALSIMAGYTDVHVAGGVEHMHHVPMELGIDPSPRLFVRHSGSILNMALTAENLTRKYGVTRREQDEFALRSHRLAADDGQFDAEIIPTWGRDEAGRRRLMRRDQSIRPQTTLEALAALEPAFQPGEGTITAGNASPISVGAAALLLTSQERARALGLRMRARVRALAVAGIDPALMGVGSVPAVQKALKRAGLKLADIDLIEINEAFAVQTLAVIKLLGADPDRVNVRGGSIAIGHPLGASGARIATTLIHAMEARKARLGLATMCIGAGQGIATIFESVS